MPAARLPPAAPPLGLQMADAAVAGCLQLKDCFNAGRAPGWELPDPFGAWHSVARDSCIRNPLLRDKHDPARNEVREQLVAEFDLYEQTFVRFDA